jgi:hypothetical protein
LLSHSNGIAARHGGEFVPSSLHGLWAWRFVVTIPASESRDDPTEPIKPTHFVWIFLTDRFPLERRSNRLRSPDKIRVGDVGCRSWTSISCIYELDRAGGSHEGYCSKLEQPRRPLDLSFLQTQPVALRTSEHLLDAPAQSIELHDLLCGCEFIRFPTNRQRRQQSPDDWLVTTRRICLAHFHIRQRDRRRIFPISMARLCNAYFSSLDAHPRNPSRIARSSRRNTNVRSAELTPVTGSVKQSLAVGKAAILRDSDDQIHIRRPAHKLGIDVEFAVADNDQLRGARKKFGRCFSCLNPADGFLILNRLRSPRGCALGRTRPDARMHETNQCLVDDVNRHRRVTEKPQRLSVSSGSQSPACAIASAEIDLGGVLHRYNPPPLARSRGAFSRGIDNLFRCYMRRSQKPMGRHLSCPTASNLADHQRASGDHPFEESCSGSFPTHITEMSNCKSRMMIHSCPPHANRQALNHGWHRKCSCKGY